jgi:hypothetical protein
MDAPDTTSDAREVARANLVNRIARIAIIIVVLCLIYVLSVGPVVGLAVFLGVEQFHPNVALLFNGFYAPVYYLGGDGPLREPLRLYLNWWVGLANNAKKP